MLNRVHPHASKQSSTRLFAYHVSESCRYCRLVLARVRSAAVLGIEGGELMSMLEIAMFGKLPYTVLRDAIFAHPTLAECFNNLFASL